MVKKGRKRGPLAVPPGRDEYEFIVDGYWPMDPDHGEWVVTPFGNVNSVVIAEAEAHGSTTSGDT